MVDVDTWIIGLNGTIYATVLHVSSNNVDTHLQGYHLLVMENILYNCDINILVTVGIIFSLVLLLSVAQL